MAGPACSVNRFSTGEIRSAGKSCLMLLGAWPFVEATTTDELGPRRPARPTLSATHQTERSFVSGGKATPSDLFYNKATRNSA